MVRPALFHTDGRSEVVAAAEAGSAVQLLVTIGADRPPGATGIRRAGHQRPFGTQMRCSVAGSGTPPKYWSRTWRKTGSPGAARMNSVMQERSFCASRSPKICAAERPCWPARMVAHSVSRVPRTGCLRYARASSSEVIAYNRDVGVKPRRRSAGRRTTSSGWSCGRGAALRRRDHRCPRRPGPPRTAGGRTGRPYSYSVILPIRSRMMKTGRPWGAEIRCFLRDPDGHLVELSQSVSRVKAARLRMTFRPAAGAAVRMGAWRF